MQIYIHIPFCEQKCNYCRFASVGKLQDLHIAKYVSFLCEEINTGDQSLKRPVSSIETIYFGGGTPGVLKLEQFEKILNAIKNKFILSENCEITIETTPDKVTPENLIGWNKLGINRISMGVQTLNEKSLEKIGRRGKGDILEALENIDNYITSGHPQGVHPTKSCRGTLYGYPEKLNLIKDFSLDLIIGLPYVKKGEILENIKFILKNYSFIKHISVYMLEDYYSADKIIETKYDNITYPDDWGKQGIKEQDYLGEYSSIKKYLIESGFNNYEISNFGKPGFECSHNIGYWNHNEVLAFGLGAYGFINNTRYANSDNFKNYYTGKKLFENKLDEEDIFLEKVMFQLRTYGLEEYIYKKLDQKKINYFIENNYLKFSQSTEVFNPLNNKKIKLTDKGVLIMDYILKEII